MVARGYRDYFKVLGVDRTANADLIKSSFRKLARKYHPDVNPDNPDAEAKFKEINEAYEVLSDTQKRKKYEQFGAYWDQSSQSRDHRAQGLDIDFGNYKSFDDFINDLLGKFVNQEDSANFSNQFRPQQNSTFNNLSLDAEVKVQISFAEAFSGTQRVLSVNEERVKVKIPEGIKSGSKLRLKGKGNLQPGTGRRGDLYLNIGFKPHPIWRIEGDQIIADLPVSIDELTLGSKIIVVTPDGEAKLNIPSSTLPGTQLRLRGKGWPTKGKRGDLLFNLIIKFPQDWTKEEIEILTELKKIRCNDPRKAWISAARI
tara:strand:- start:903 stop:1844 length:942 start_codon:yes stop_codon:yes gene_type:complete